MPCPCDIHDCEALSIPAGLTSLPRAPGGFAQWRAHLLAAIGREPALDQWRAREAGDLGLMLAEFFAYMCDIASFYDALTANASYLGTVADAAGPRRLVALLGYQPRPAFGAALWLAAEADGVRLVALPRGTGFRSGAFPGSAPQLFELTADAVVEPRINRFAVDRVPAASLPESIASLPVVASTLRAAPGQLVVLASGNGSAVGRIAHVEPMRLRIARKVLQVQFAVPIAPPAGATYANSRLLRAGARCSAWKGTPASGETAVIAGNALSLDIRAPIQAGDVVLVEGPGAAVARRVTAVGEVAYILQPGLTSTITDDADKVSTLLSPPIKGVTARITLDDTLPFTDGDVGALVVHYGLAEAATLHVPLKDMIESGDPLTLPALIDGPRVPITALALEDAHGEGVVTTGTIDAASHSATTADMPAWPAALTQPVMLFGNMVLASRGETVAGELLGIGNASKSLQVFRLRKKPLTYLAAANATGRASSLVVHVGGIAWREVASFYGQADDAMVYVVRHDEAGETDIIFGGGARLPSGARVVADYRFGAGALAPPAGSVNQLAHPIAGLRAVRNILPAFGGADAEGAGETAIRGPASALLLGRAISLPDIETAAARQPGVRAVRARWQWDAMGLRPAVMLCYIGDPQIAPAIRAALRALAEEDAPISVAAALAQAATLRVDITADPAFVADDVADAVGTALFALVTLPGTGGLLRAERLGPDNPLFASLLVHAIMAVPGVLNLNALLFDETPFVETARVPATGAFFDFADGGIRINGRSAG